MFQILYIVFLIFIGYLIVLGVCKLLIGKSVCNILGHNWERLCIDRHKKTNKLQTTIKYKCRNCGGTKTEKFTKISK